MENCCVIPISHQAATPKLGDRREGALSPRRPLHPKRSAHGPPLPLVPFPLTGKTEQEDPIDELLKDLSTNGKENTSAGTTTSSATTSAELPFPGDLSDFYDSPLVGGPLSGREPGDPPPPLSDANQKKEKKQRTKKQDEEGRVQSQAPLKKKDKTRKKEKANGVEQKEKDGRRGSLWAGSAFLKSPAPEDVPLPSAGLLAGVRVVVAREDGEESNTTAESELKKMLNMGGDLGGAALVGEDVVANDIRMLLKMS